MLYASFRPSIKYEDLTNILIQKTCLIISCLILLHSCTTVYKLVSQEELGALSVKASVEPKINLPPKHCIVHVQADGKNFRYYYLFYSDRIIKQNFKRHESILYQLSFDNSKTSTISHIDSIIFNRVASIVDSLQLKNIMNPSGATGFIIERVYKLYK